MLLSLVQSRTGTSFVLRLGDLPLERVLEMSAAEVAERASLTPRMEQGFEETRQSFDLRRTLAPLEERGLSVVTLADEEYPERLREIADPPPALYVDGELPVKPVVSLVGSRKASATGIENAREIGRALGRRGVCVGSGLALGIDAAAHEGALEAEGPVVGVLGCGIDVVYPRKHRNLFGRVKAVGTLVSEYYLGESPLQWRFPARNRVISGLSETVVVVEAAERSGALITARHAAEAGRDVYSVPGPIGLSECRGSNRLLADGAGVVLDAEEFAETIAPGEPELSLREKTLSEAEPLSETESRVLGGMGIEPSGTDSISRESGVEVRELLPALSMLELKGYVIRDGAGSFARRGR